MTDLSLLDATAQAELVRNGDASPAELVDGAIDRIEKLNGELNAVIHPLFDRARAAVQRGLARRAVHRRADRRQGPRRHARRRAVPRGQQGAEGGAATSPRRRATCSRSSNAPGFVIVGKTNTPEFGLMPTAEPEAYGPDAQSVEPRAQQRRFERWVGGRGRERHGPRRSRRRRRRIDPHPREHVRAVRPEADARPRVARPRRARGVGRARDAPRGDAHRARQRGRARRARRAT